MTSKPAEASVEAPEPAMEALARALAEISRLEDLVSKYEAGAKAAQATLEAVTVFHQSQLAEHRAALENLVKTNADLAAERDRYTAENARLWQRIQHAKDTLGGLFTPPQMDEIRKVRGLEPL